MYEQEIEDIATKFYDFLSKENVISGKAIENAESLYKSRQREFLIQRTLPKAWEKVINEPDELLVEILAETTERLCGYKPNNEVVEHFLAEVARGYTGRGSKRSYQSKQKFQPVLRNYDDYTGKVVVAFKLGGARYPVRTWKEMLMKLTEIVAVSHRNQFDRVLNLVGRKRPYFSSDPNELVKAERVNGTKLYVETNLSANSIVKLCRKVIMLFGYTEDELVIEVR